MKPKRDLLVVVSLAALFGAVLLVLERYQNAGTMPVTPRHSPKATREVPITDLQTFRDCDGCPLMVVMPTGSVMMGSPESEPGRSDNEGPQHLVTINYRFAVGQFPVTVQEYARFVTESGYSVNDEWKTAPFRQGGTQPVVNVSWHDAQAYIQWLSEKTGYRYRLLSEAEYEYAERGGTTTAYWWGDQSVLCSHVNAVSCGGYGTVAADTYPASGFRLNDMAGNVLEWTEDCYHDSYKGAPTDGSAWTTGECGDRVLRGGSWFSDPTRLRSAYRFAEAAIYRGSESGVTFGLVGFRVAKTLSENSAENRTAEENQEFRDCQECPEMATVPPGTFVMGSPESESGHDSDEGPQHQVTIGYSFAVAKYPVTREEYGKFVGDSAYDGGDCWRNPEFAQTGRDPVVCVSWNDAQAYVRWLNQKTGRKYRLLSEAEYEYVERAGTTTAYWWGDNPGEMCNYANGADCLLHYGTIPVGSYPQNAFGLYDMVDGVMEWTEDCYHDNYEGAPRDGSAWSTDACRFRVQRGGSSVSPEEMLRSAHRSKDIPGNRMDDYGFRVARVR